MDIKLAALSASADLTRQWLVVDLDAFFASVEELDDPTLVSPAFLCSLSSVTLPAVCVLNHVESCRVPSSLGSLQASTSLADVLLVQKTKPMAVGGIGMISTANCEPPSQPLCCLPSNSACTQIHSNVRDVHRSGGLKG